VAWVVAPRKTLSSALRTDSLGARQRLNFVANCVTPTGDLDSLFIFKNVIVAVEDTTLASRNIGDHLRKKAEYFTHLAANKSETIRMLLTHFPRFADYYQQSEYEAGEYHIRFVYASRHEIDEDYQKRYAESCRILSYASLQYFVSLTKVIKRSSKFELLKFLEIGLHQLGSSKSKTGADTFSALQLPEIPSGFPSGHKLVSFLVDPDTLLERAYVLRADSWRDRDALYQRLLIRNKIASMRRYLVEEKRVFINNIIVTLSSDAIYRPTKAPQPMDDSSTYISTGELTIPQRFDAIGIIDGQHRVYAYHEGDDTLDRKIAGLRGKQHLLVTGIIYPPSVPASDAEAFEAKLFLEINDKQSRVKGDLKQAIELVVNPCSDVAIAKAVLHRLDATGPLVGVLGLHFFDVGKLRTTSIVSYGLRNIVGFDKEVSFFQRWRNAEKQTLRNVCDRALLDQYVHYCGSELNKFVSAFKATQPESLWTTDQKQSRLLTTTTINGLIFCMRLLLQHDQLGSFDQYRQALSQLSVDFRPGQFEYKSSHWRDLGRKIYEECFQ
jgi:DGQHR domain-containing protein